jgi:acyl transferase domain-containing protein
MGRSLQALAKGTKAAPGDPRVVTGTALSNAARVCFVFNGNGAQWAGMGQRAYAANADFRAGFDRAGGLRGAGL